MKTTLDKYRIWVCLVAWLLAIGMAVVDSETTVGMITLGVMVLAGVCLTIWEIRQSYKER